MLTVATVVILSVAEAPVSDSKVAERGVGSGVESTTTGLVTVKLKTDEAGDVLPVTSICLTQTWLAPVTAVNASLQALSLLGSTTLN